MSTTSDGGRLRRALDVHPELWVSWRPNGAGLTKPHHFREMVEVAWDNRAHPHYAWQVLSKGVCDGCALGVAGFHDWTLDGVHLCTTRLRMLETNTADAFDPVLLEDVSLLADRTPADLRALGRLGYPMRRRRGEPGFRRISWDEAAAVSADALAAAAPERIALYVTSKGLTNETYYVAGKAARALGIASVDSAARVCHAPSTVGLKTTIGVAASTCSLQDVLETDCIVIWGANPANNQPVFTKYLHLAKANGARIVVVNPYLEPGLERYWVPSIPESALFGTKLCDLHVPVRPGGDVALANAVCKRLIERGDVDDAFIAAHTEGWDELAEAVAAQPLVDLLEAAGIDAATLEAFVDCYAGADAAIVLWSMGITQNRDAVEAVQGLVNVALARGNVGRDGAGLMPLRGHSGVQGGAEMGAYATALPGGAPVDAEHAAALAAQWGFPVPDAPGLTAAEMLEAAERGELDVLWCSGGNFLDVLPDPPRVATALGRVPTRIHHDVLLTTQMLIEGDDVVLLPVTTRYEQEGGGTSTTTERRVAFSPEIPRRVGEARTEWRLFADLAMRGAPRAVVRLPLARQPGVARRDRLRGPVLRRHRTTGPHRRRHPMGRPAPVRRRLVPDAEWPRPVHGARRRCPRGAGRDVHRGARRGKQFNSMVLADTDPLTGARRTRCTSTPPTLPAWASARGRRSSCGARWGRCVAGSSWSSCRAGPCRCTGRRATCCSVPAPSIASRTHRCPTTTPW
ncbi:MAG: molybdopterin-dependent oxidoreductase [Acidimicrobiales bacterium]